MANDLINDAYMIKTSTETPKQQSANSYLVGEYIKVPGVGGGGGDTSEEGVETACAPPPPHTFSCASCPMAIPEVYPVSKESP